MPAWSNTATSYEYSTPDLIRRSTYLRPLPVYTTAGFVPARPGVREMRVRTMSLPSAQPREIDEPRGRKLTFGFAGGVLSYCSSTVTGALR